MNKKYFALIGIIGSFISVIADLFLAFYPQGIHGFESIYSVDINKVFTVFSQADHTRLIYSNYLAMIGIPLGFSGLYYIFLNLRQEGISLHLSRIFIIGGAIGYLSGTIFHVSLSFIATAFRIKLNADPFSKEVITNMIDLFIDFSQPLAYLFLLINFIVSAIFFILVISKKATAPSWACIINPLFIQLLFALIASFLPIPVKTFLIVSVYNFSLMIFYLSFYLIPKKGI